MYKDVNKYKGGITLSSDVSYQGRKLTFIDDENCTFNLNEVIDRIDLALKHLADDVDFSALDKKNFVFNPATVTSKELFQILINSTDALITSTNNLSHDFDNLNIGSKNITLDLGCLTPDASGCAVGENTYTLLSILALFKNEICSLKNS